MSVKPALSKPPNILFLMSDQHRYDVAGFMGNPVVRTPTLDYLANSGVVFDNAYTPSPICVPGRQCIMSGQLPGTNNCKRYGEDLPPFSPTFARQLSEIGYQTVCAGKLHHQGLDQMQGWTQRIGMDTDVEPSYLGESAAALHQQYNAEKPGNWDLRKELTMAGAGINPFKVNDDYTVTGALNFIRERFCGTWYDRTDHRPLLLKVSLQCPHYPFICSEPKFNYYINRIQPYPERSGIINHPFARDWTHQPAVSERERLRAIAAYYGMVEEVDEAFNSILSALEFAGQDMDDWIIIYTSDHGDMLGEFDTWWKLKFYEGSVRVPLFIRAPRLFEANRIAANVSLCDLYATLCQLSGAAVPEDRDSRSLLPLLTGSAADWPDTAQSQYMDHKMVRSGPWKYWHLAPDTEVLFNLAQDPHEETNLAQDPAYSAILADLRGKLA